MPTRLVLANGLELTLEEDPGTVAAQLRLDTGTVVQVHAVGEAGESEAVWINPAHVAFLEEGRASPRAEPPGI